MDLSLQRAVAPTLAFSAAARFAGVGLAAFRGGRAVFRGLDFSLDPGGALLLVGPNGCGKSTLLRIMAGLTRARAGALRWGDEDLDPRTAEHRARLSWSGWLDAIKPTLTCGEHLRLYAAADGHAPEISPADALTAVGLAGFSDRPGRFLSAGQRKRVALARLLVRRAPLWLLDEPTTGLDADGARLFQGLATRHLTDGGMIVAATHADLGVPAERLSPAAFAPLAVVFEDDDEEEDDEA